ncbi:MAG TPA: hypothetical protein VH619_12310 [Verrucomicrobiae bacterium]|nr:hypothetical protein [Verrucomicrobiae bacterium]
MRFTACFAAVLLLAPNVWAGKKIVFLAGEEEYRSEEGLPMLAKILVHQGFDCRVLFTVNPATGDVDPDCQTNLPGIGALDTADLCVMQLRFRELPDAQMKHFVDYLNSGKPIIALRTSTHAFAYQRNTNSPYAKYDWRSQVWPGGFGRQVLGETWVSHHGEHGEESTRGIVNGKMAADPILRGMGDLWWPSDVYTVTHLPADARVLVWGQVLSGMKPGDPPVAGAQNDPLTPVVWVRDYKGEAGKITKIVTCTAGAAVDLQDEGLRRLVVNACYWTLGLDVPDKADVAYVGDYRPSFFGFGGGKKGVKPEDLYIGR